MAEKFRLPVSELLERFSSKELSQWSAYYRVQAFKQKQAMEKQKAKNAGRRHWR